MGVKSRCALDSQGSRWVQRQRGWWWGGVVVVCPVNRGSILVLENEGDLQNATISCSICIHNIYIYIYMCVCVCVFFAAWRWIFSKKIRCCRSKIWRVLIQQGDWTFTELITRCKELWGRNRSGVAELSDTCVAPPPPNLCHLFGTWSMVNRKETNTWTGRRLLRDLKCREPHFVGPFLTASSYRKLSMKPPH